MKSKVIICILSLFLVGILYALQADIITVNANSGYQYLTIQDAIDCWSSDPMIINSSFFNNMSYGWATIGIWDTSSPSILICIISNNTGSGFVFHSQSEAIVEFCNCFNNSY